MGTYPPYLRHHKITAEIKARCQEIVQSELGIKIDARAGLHIYFLVKSLAHLNDGGCSMYREIKNLARVLKVLLILEF